jgi:hypothetical protein
MARCEFEAVNRHGRAGCTLSVTYVVGGGGGVDAVLEEVAKEALEGRQRGAHVDESAVGRARLEERRRGQGREGRRVAATEGAVDMREMEVGGSPCCQLLW